MIQAIAQPGDPQPMLQSNFGIKQDLVLTKQALVEHILFINKLITAASTLLMILNNINKVTGVEEVTSFRAAIIQEIKLFKRLAQQYNYPSKTVDHAIYLLSAAIDEAVLKTSWGMLSMWSKQPLLGELFNDLTGGVKFFSLIDTLLQDNKIEPELLALAYVILSIGYNGQYFATNDLSRLDNIRQLLFKEIPATAKPAKNFSKIITYTKAANKRWLHFSIFGLIIWAILILSAMLFSYNLLTQRLANPIFDTLKQFHANYFNMATRGNSL